MEEGSENVRRPLLGDFEGDTELDTQATQAEHPAATGASAPPAPSTSTANGHAPSNNSSSAAAAPEAHQVAADAGGSPPHSVNGVPAAAAAGGLATGLPVGAGTSPAPPLSPHQQQRAQQPAAYQLLDVPDARAAWAKMRTRVLCMGVMAALNVLVPGMPGVVLVVTSAGLLATTVYFVHRCMPSSSVWDRARVVKICSVLCIAVSALNVFVFSALLVGVGVSGSVEREEEQEWHESVRDLVVLLLLLLTWHGSFLWLAGSITRQASRVMALSNPVSSGVIII